MQNIERNCSPLGRLLPSATLALAAKAKELKAQGDDVCSITAGEPDFDTPQVIKDACIQAINEGKVHYLASSGLPELKKEIVRKFADNGIVTKSENIIISTGAKFALFQAITALCGKDDEVILFAPYWVSYAEMVKAADAKVVVVNTTAENHYAPTKEALEKAINDRTKLIIVNSPNNPTGAVYSRATLEMIAEIAIKSNIMVLSDEIYEKLIYDDNVKHISIASLNPQIAALTITVNGFSKSYAMTGWRLGYLNAPLWLTKRISALQSHTTSNATSFVQYAAVTALAGAANVDAAKMVKTFGERREMLCHLLEQIPQIKIYRPQGAFYVLCDISALHTDADTLADNLLKEEKLAVIPGTSFGVPQTIRLSYACSEQTIQEAVRRLQHYCQGK